MHNPQIIASSYTVIFGGLFVILFLFKDNIMWRPVTIVAAVSIIEQVSCSLLTWHVGLWIWIIPFFSSICIVALAYVVKASSKRSQRNERTNDTRPNEHARTTDDERSVGKRHSKERPSTSDTRHFISVALFRLGTGSILVGYAIFVVLNVMQNGFVLR